MNIEQSSDLKRRDFLRGGSFATLAMLMGGVPIRAAEEAKPEASTNATVNADGSTNYKGESIPVNVGVVGCGLWAREILKTLARMPNGPVVALCDTYPTYLRRAGDLAPKAEKLDDYKKLLANKAVQAVIVATPTHLHKEVVLAALAAGKHVYCEAPLASNLDDARAIAQAAKSAIKLNFQVGLQNRSDKQITNLSNFVRTGVLGKTLKVRAQYHKKTNWRLTSPNADREKEINWRLNKDTSVGLTGEIGIHQIDIANWFLMTRPASVAGFGSLIQWKDGREVPDNVQVIFEYPSGARLSFECTIGNSFEAENTVFYGTDCAIMARERRAWMFKEVDSPLLGWEVYARKDAFYKESGIVLGAGATKQVTHSAKGTADDVVDESSALQYSLQSFLVNSASHGSAVEDFAQAFDINDTKALKEHLAGLEKHRLPAAGYQEGYEAAVAVIKANETIAKGQKINFDPAWFEVG